MQQNCHLFMTDVTCRSRVGHLVVAHSSHSVLTHSLTSVARAHGYGYGYGYGYGSDLPGRRLFHRFFLNRIIFSYSVLVLLPRFLLQYQRHQMFDVSWEGLAVDPVSWPWTSPNQLIDTQSEFNHALGELTHELSSPPTCCQSWVLMHSIMSTYRQRFPSVIQQTLWLLYSGGFDCACSLSSRTFFFFLDYSHLLSGLDSILITYLVSCPILICMIAFASV